MLGTSTCRRFSSKWQPLNLRVAVAGTVSTSALKKSDPVACLMQLEFHQLDRRWEHLRVRHPARQRRLLASLAENGQQTPIVVVAAEDHVDRYVVIDG